MKEDTSTRLKRIMQERNLKQVDILNMSKPFQSKFDIKMSKSHLSQYVNGKSQPDQHKVFLLAQTLNVSEAWLMGYDVDRNNKDSIKNDFFYIYKKLSDKRKERVYSFAEIQLKEQLKETSIKIYGNTAAGDPIAYTDDVVEEKQVSYIPNGAECALTVKGDSMEPEIMDGSIVFYKQQPSVENGEIAIIEIDGDGVTCKKVKYDYENQKVILQSLNPKYEDMIFDNKHIRVLGKVIK